MHCSRAWLKAPMSFLNGHLNELEESPKFSIINFASAIELFLKSRLLKEHWTLVLADVNKGNPTAAKFLEGDALTVTPTKAIQRLKDIVGMPVHENAINAFKSVANHRNKAIHFVHEMAAPVEGQVQDQSELIGLVVAEQYLCLVSLESIAARFMERAF